MRLVVLQAKTRTTGRIDFNGAGDAERIWICGAVGLRERSRAGERKHRQRKNTKRTRRHEPLLDKNGSNQLNSSQVIRGKV